MSDIIRKFQYHGKDSLSLPAERNAFITLKMWISGIAEELELAEKTIKQLLIAADEIFTNIANYGYPREGGEAEVMVEFNFTQRFLSMTFLDAGVAYNPLESAAPDISSPLAEREVGGLGVFIVKKLMDSVEYRRENNLNILTMTKSIPNTPTQKTGLA